MSRTSARWLYVSLALLLLALRPMSAVAQPSAPADSVWTYDSQTPDAACPSPATCAIWKAFRKAHPEPYQTIALKEDGGDAVIVISEPPPSVSRSDLVDAVKAVFGDDLAEIAHYRLSVGLDGWLEDLVFRVHLHGADRVNVLSGETLEHWPAPAEVVDRLRLIDGLLYGATNTLWIDRIGDAPTAAKYNFDYKITPANLNDWLSGETSTWDSLSPGGEKVVWKDILTGRTADSYRQDSGRLVVLVAPRGATLDHLFTPFRRFAVASDIIVGAFSSKGGGLILVGRARGGSLLGAAAASI